MAFCKNCGQDIADAQFCPNCGTPADEQVTEAAQTAETAQKAEQTAPIQPEVVAADPDEDVKNNKSIAWLSYFGILLLIPLFARKASAYCKFHVKQGVILFAADICYLIVTRILLAIIGAVFRPEVKYLFYVPYYVPHPVYSACNIIFSLAGIFFLVLAIIGIVNSVKGETKKLPVLGDIKILDPLMDKIYDALNK